MELPRSTPSAQGVDSRGIDRFLTTLNDGGIELHSLMLLRHGNVIAEGWWEPYGRDRVHLLYSLSKSFASTAIGLLIDEGRLSTDDTVVSFFPDRVPADPSPQLLNMRVHHLLCMGTGHAEDTTRDVFANKDLDPVRAFFAIPPDQEPGTVFAYNSTATYMLSAILTAVTGETLTQYLRPRLFEPLGIDEAFWQSFDGVDAGFTGLHVATESIARFGQLYLQRGRWNGRQLVPESWVATATSRHIDTVTPWRQNEPIDWSQGYGYQFWKCRHGAYRGDGAHGQFCVVLPDSDVVLVTTAATSDMQAVLTAAWDHLLPSLDGQSDAQADTALLERLGGLQLPPLPALHGGPDSVVFSSAVPAEDRDNYPFGETVTVKAADGGWILRLDDGPEVTCGRSRWDSGVVSADGLAVPVAASAGWGEENVFSADLIFVETPHRLRIRGDGRAGEFTLSWNVQPLSGSGYSRLVAPRQERK